MVLDVEPRLLRLRPARGRSGARGFIPKGELSGARDRGAARAVSGAALARCPAPSRALALFVAGAVRRVASLVLTSDHEDQKAVAAILGPLIGLGFIGTGLFAWWRRPQNRFGALMTAVGFAWFARRATRVRQRAVVSTLGCYLGPLYLVLVVQLAARRSRPGGSRRRRRARSWAPPTSTRSCCPLPVFLLDGDINARPTAPGQRAASSPTPATSRTSFDVATLDRRLSRSSSATAVVLLRSAAPRDAAAAPRAWRRCCGPGLTLIIALGLAVRRSTPSACPTRSSTSSSSWASSPSRSCRSPSSPASCARATSRAGAVGELSSASTRRRATAACATRSPTRSATRRSQLVYWLRRPERYVDREGRPVDAAGRRRPAARVAEVERDGEPRRRDRPRRRAARRPEPRPRRGGAAAALALENERLEAELRARVEELQTLARPARRGRDGRAPPPRARPARRRPAAARRAVAAARPGARASSTDDPGVGGRLLDARARRARPRARGAARARAGHPSGRSSPTAGSARRSRRSPSGRPLPVDLTRCPTIACQPPWRPRPTSSSPSR